MLSVLCIKTKGIVCVCVWTCARVCVCAMSVEGTGSSESGVTVINFPTWVLETEFGSSAGTV